MCESNENSTETENKVKALKLRGSELDPGLQDRIRPSCWKA